VNIFLTPVDVLRLSRKLNLSTTDFLDRHTLVPITKELYLPVVVLRMGEDEKKRCPFVSDAGCQVYEDRPWSCRMYPVGMGLPPARAGEEPKPMFFLFEDEFCKGRGEQAEWTVAKWRADQGVEQQEEIETGYREIVSHPWFIGGTRRLDPKRLEMFYTGCYDLDTFRRFVFESTFLNRFELDEELVKKIRASDEELLRFAFRWLRFALFAEPTLKVRPGSDK
jgi:Fe-S-cluster containining protein